MSSQGVPFSDVGWENIAQLGIKVQRRREGPESPPTGTDPDCLAGVYKVIAREELDSVVERRSLGRWWTVHGGDVSEAMVRTLTSILTTNEALTTALLHTLREHVCKALESLGFRAYVMLEATIPKHASASNESDNSMVTEIQYEDFTTTLSGRIDGMLISFSKDNIPHEFRSPLTVEDVVRVVRHYDANASESKKPPTMLVCEKKRQGISEEANHGGLTQVLAESLTLMHMTRRPLQPFVWTSGIKWRFGVLDGDAQSTTEQKIAWIGPVVQVPLSADGQGITAGFDEGIKKLFHIVLFLAIAPPTRIRHLIWRLNETSDSELEHND